jgi:hypothetical protein
MLAISGRTALIHVDERNARCREQRLDIPPPNRSSIATQSPIDNERASGFVRTKARSVRLAFAPRRHYSDPTPWRRQIKHREESRGLR